MVPQQRRRRRRTALPRAAERRVVVGRGLGGFGFTIAGQRPCVVSAVATGGPAERAGLRAGDALLAVDGASVARAPHAAVARLVAGAHGPIELGVALREPAPTDTEDTEPEERARTRRRHPPPRRRLHPPNLHLTGCIGPSTSGVMEMFHNLSHMQQLHGHAASLECRAAVGYLGTIETPQASSSGAPGEVRAAVKKLRQERRVATPVLLSVQPTVLLLRRPRDQPLAEYPRERIVHAGCGSDLDRRYFGLVTAADPDASHSCHVFAVDPRMAEHEAHADRAMHFQIECTRDPVAERCLEFPPSAEYVVGVIRGMYSLPPDDHTSPTLQQISKLAIKGDSPLAGNFARCSRAVFRAPRDRRMWHDEGQEPVANSPQPSNHSEITTTSSNSDSGIGFHNDCRNIADRILVVDFVGQQLPPNRFKPEVPRRPIGLVGCGSFDGESSFLSNTKPVVDDFGGLERPLDDEVMLSSNDLQSILQIPRSKEDYNYNNIYSNVPPLPQSCEFIEDRVQTEPELSPPAVDNLAETFNCVDIDEDRECQSTESLENVSVISGAYSKASMDSVSVHSTRSAEEARAPRRQLQASLDDMLVLGLNERSMQRKPPPKDHNFLHPGAVKIKVRKLKPLGLMWKTLGGKRRTRAFSGDASDRTLKEPPLPAAASEPDLRDQSDRSSPFRRWTTENGAGASYRSEESRAPRKPQQLDQDDAASTSSAVENPAETLKPGSVALWSLGLEQLLMDPTGRAAFTAFLAKEFASENVHFWTACESYARILDEIKRKSEANSIWDLYLSDKAPELVNLDSKARNTTKELISMDPPPRDAFRQAQSHIFALLKFDNYPRFLRSDIHAQCARADLSGLPLPYGQQQATEATTKVKKSASNVADTRRSGASLLPWRRGHSRERAPSAPNTTAGGAPSTTAGGAPSTTAASREPQPGPSHQSDPPALPPRDRSRVHDIVMNPTGEAGLCRVVMPDGATSVVGVERSQDAREVVDRLFVRRQMRPITYDIITADEQQPRIIDLEAPAMSLTGREVRIEERAVVRFSVGDRPVGVRCRETRRLRRVLGTLRELMPPLEAGMRAVAAIDGYWLHPDTHMIDLHGHWLTVHQVAVSTRRPRSPTPRASDCDLYDVLVVANEEQLNTDHRFEAIRVRPSLEMRKKVYSLGKSQLLQKATSSVSVAGTFHAASYRDEETIPLRPSRTAPSPIASINESEFCAPVPIPAPRTNLPKVNVEARRGRTDFIKAPARVESPSHAVAPSRMHGPPTARVRAALRPGPPVHVSDPVQAPRATQSQESGLLPPLYPPPPPPPLPRKPKLPRIPTLV